ncbi:MAG: FAD-dependent oxidoreductase [Pseudomonadota bacterium]
MKEPRRLEAIAPLPATQRLEVDLCVVGAGAAGVSAAVEGGRLGLKVALVDGLTQIGGQSVNGLIGTLCGFFSTGDAPFQLSYGFAGDVLADLQAADALAWRPGRRSLVGLYDEHALAGSYARHLRDAGVTVVLGAMLVGTQRDGDRLREVSVQTRYGPLAVSATTFVDASGDAMLATLAGAAVQQPDAPVYGTSMFSITQLGQPIPPRAAVIERLEAVAAQYGLERRDGFVFEFPGRDLCLVNLTHFQTPLDAIAMSRVALESRTTIDRVMAFLRAEFPQAFGHARIQSIGQPGVRQTRGIAALRTLTTAEVRSGQRPADAIGRCAWPIEFHGSAEGVYWETFDDGHITWIPLGAMISRDLRNLIAAGRCVDAEPFALGAIRVIGPCMAMGAAAAAAAAAAQTTDGDLHALDVEQVRLRVADNTDRRDPAPFG